jgi:hypothetical protein
MAKQLSGPYPGLTKGAADRPKRQQGWGTRSRTSRPDAVRQRADGQYLPPPGPSNIIVVTPNLLPAPKTMDSQ